MLVQLCYVGGIFEGGVDVVMVEDVVCWGSVGGVQIFGLVQSGILQVGMQVDFVIYWLDDLCYFGLYDMVIGLVVCGGCVVLKVLLFNGCFIVEDDVIFGFDFDVMCYDVLVVVCIF